MTNIKLDKANFTYQVLSTHAWLRLTTRISSKETNVTPLHLVMNSLHCIVFLLWPLDKNFNQAA